MINVSDRGLCCGCGACADVCPRGAVKMERDALGFEYPSVDESLCVECGLCEKVCGFRKAVEMSERGAGAENEGSLKGSGASTPAVELHRPLQVVAARHRDMGEVMRSRSGAAFPALTDAVLSRGGTVFGAALSEDCRRVEHRAAASAAARDAFRGSKYIQSRTREAFLQLRKELGSGREVVFSGTPCQCNALRSFIPAPLQEKLTLVDFVCHGVGSPAFWDRYLDHISRGRKIVKADFRDKGRFGWKDHRESFTFEDGSVKISRSFTNIYYKHLIMRPSCARCPFNTVERCGDITLADFWGWEKTDPALNADDRGYSLILVGTEKGRKLLEDASESLNIRPVDLSTCLQRPLRERLVPGASSGAFEQAFIGGTPMGKLLRRYGDRNLRTAGRRFWLYLRKRLRKILKKDNAG